MIPTDRVIKKIISVWLVGIIIIIAYTIVVARSVNPLVGVERNTTKTSRKTTEAPVNPVASIPPALSINSSMTFLQSRPVVCRQGAR